MKRKIKVSNNKAVTDLAILISQIPDHFLYHLEHGLRPPLGIYNISTIRVIVAFKEIFDALKSIVNYDDEQIILNNLLKGSKDKFALESGPEIKNTLSSEISDYEQKLNVISAKQSGQDRNLLNKIKELLDSLMSFIDDTYHIMKTVFPANSITKPPLFADKWMEKAEKRITSEYKSKINEYRDFLAPIVNKIKHNHGRLNAIKLVTGHGVSFGYYIEGVDLQGVLGSDRLIHKQYKNQDTAFSLNRDMKYHLCNFIFICHHLKVVMQRILKDKHRIEINNFDLKIEGSEELLQVAKEIEELPNLFFPDEIYKPVPEIIATDEDVEFVFPSSNAKLLLYGDSEIRSSMIGDGVTKSFQLPYWNPRR